MCFSLHFNPSRIYHLGSSKPKDVGEGWWRVEDVEGDGETVRLTLGEWVSERQSRGGRAGERERERDWARMSSSSMQAVLPARQSFYEFPLTLSLSLSSHVHRTHSFLLSGHCRERTDRNHHGIGIRPGKRGKIKPLLSSSLFFPRLFFSSAFFCLFASSPSPSMSLNSFWRDWIKEKWGL